MKKFLLLLTLIAASFFFAQLVKNRLIKPGLTSGKVIDNNSKDPLP